MTKCNHNPIPSSKEDLRTLPQPEPMPNIAAYERELKLCLAADPRRKENYERYLASRRKGANVDFLPTRIDVEPVSRCNFRCSMCQVSGWEKGRRARDMDINEFKQLLDDQHGLVEVKNTRDGRGFTKCRAFL